MLPTPQMVWIDYETNGVHEETAVMPFEVGLIVTDRAGNEISSFESLILEPGWQQYMNRSVPIVKQMHTKSGLIRDLEELNRLGVESYRKYSHRAIERKILDWLEMIPFRSDDNGKVIKLPMTGSTVHFDRRVTQEWMPDLNRWFHYRNQDVSSLKNFCQLTNPDLYARLPKDNNKTHRPLADLRNSIREYQWYRENFLFIEGDRRW